MVSNTIWSKPIIYFDIDEIDKFQSDEIKVQKDRESNSIKVFYKNKKIPNTPKEASKELNYDEKEIPIIANKLAINPTKSTNKIVPDNDLDELSNFLSQNQDLSKILPSSNQIYPPMTYNQPLSYNQPIRNTYNKPPPIDNYGYYNNNNNNISTVNQSSLNTIPTARQLSSSRAAKQTIHNPPLIPPLNNTNRPLPTPSTNFRNVNTPSSAINIPPPNARQLINIPTKAAQQPGNIPSARQLNTSRSSQFQPQPQLPPNQLNIPRSSQFQPQPQQPQQPQQQVPLSQLPPSHVPTAKGLLLKNLSEPNPTSRNNQYNYYPSK